MIIGGKYDWCYNYLFQISFAASWVFDIMILIAVKDF